jgi:hypothetical protein
LSGERELTAMLHVSLRHDEVLAHQRPVALLIHCENESARDFYLRLAKFDASPTDPMHLFLVMKDLRKAITGS